MLLIKEALRGTKKNFKQYISLFLFLFLTVAVFSAMITNSIQSDFAISQLENKSLVYDFQINGSFLNMKYDNMTQKELNKRSDTDDDYIKNFYGNILEWFNPYDSDLGDDFDNYTFLKLKSEISNSYISWTGDIDDGTWKLTSNLDDPDQQNTTNNWQYAWIKIIGNYSSKNLSTSSEDKNYISYDGVTNYVFYEVLENDNSPMYKSISGLNPILNSENKPIISYVHNFYCTINTNTKKLYYSFESANNNETFNIPDKPEFTINPDDKSSNPISFFSRNEINQIVSDKFGANHNLNNNEIMINYQFAKKNKYDINSNINFADSYNPKVIDYASATSDIFPLTQSVNSLSSSFNDSGLKNGSYVFLNKEDYLNQKLNLSNSDGRNTSDTYIYIKIPNATNLELNNFITGNNGLFSNYFMNKSNVFYSFKLSSSGQVATSNQTLLLIELIVCGVVIFVIFIILLFFIRKRIETYYNKIGILKAIGYTNKKIAIIFSVSLLFVVFLALFVGFFGSVPFQIYFSNSSIYSIGVNLHLFYYNFEVILFCFLYLPIFLGLLIYLFSTIIVNKNLLLLIYNIPSKTNKLRKHHKKNKLKKKHTPFFIRLSFSFVTNSLSKWILVFSISSFSTFILLFQFNVNVFTNDFDNSQYDFLNSDVKIISSTNVDQLDSLVSNKSSLDPIQQFHTYKWISSVQANQDLFQLKLCNYDETINIPDLANTLKYFFAGVKEDQIDDLKKVAGPSFSKLFFLQKNQYISSVDSYKLIHMTMTTKDPKNPHHLLNVNVWKWILDNWNDIKEYIETDIPFAIDEFSIDKFYNLVTFLNNYDLNAHGIYPNIYLGNYNTYDKTFEKPEILIDANWANTYNNNNDIFSLLQNVQLLSVDSSSSSVFNNFFNLQFKNNNLNNVLQKLNDIQIIDDINHATGTEQLGNIQIPVIISKTIAKSNNFKVGDLIKLNINILNGYQPITCKVAAISVNDFSSQNIYVSYNDLNLYIKEYTELLNDDIPKEKIPDYYNVLLSKGDENDNDILKVYRNLNIVADKEKDYNYVSSSFLNNYSLTTDTLGPLANGFDKLQQSTLSEMSDLNSVQSIYLLKNLYSTTFNDLNKQMIMSEVVTIIIDLFILFSLIGIIFDDNHRTILTMKALGYSSFKVSISILIFYFLVMIIGFPISILLVLSIWKIVLSYLFYKIGILMTVRISWIYLLITFGAIIIISLLNFINGYVHINKEKINTITDL